MCSFYRFVLIVKKYFLSTSELDQDRKQHKTSSSKAYKRERFDKNDELMW